MPLSGARNLERVGNPWPEDHYGLEDVKERILEHIAVNFLQAMYDPLEGCRYGQESEVFEHV